MPTNYTGDPSNITTPLAATVIDATNASPIVVQTSAPHLFGDGDTVVVDGVGGNTGANGVFTITVTGADTFELDGSTGTGSYTSGGTATDISLTPYGQLPSAGDALSVGGIVPFLMMLADRTQYLFGGGGSPIILVEEFLTSTVGVIVPANARYAWVEACGGGGGGGGGTTGQSGGGGGRAGCGGGGGGSAIFSGRFTPVVGRAAMTMTIGAGGSGGAANNSGSNGGDTTFGALLTFLGAGGGMGYSGNWGAANEWRAAPGGGPVRNPTSTVWGHQWAGAAQGTQVARVMNGDNTGLILRAAQSGGFGPSTETGADGQSGMGSPQGFLGGAGGGYASNDSPYYGGGGGGGGAGGPFGAGGAGGAGSNANASGNGTTATAGTAGAANTGAGGGGGGAGGGASGTGGTGGAGGAGGSGYLRVFWLR